MAYFPFFMDISGQSCVIAGGGKVAFRKIEVLLEFGAKIIVIAPDICSEITALKEAAETAEDGLEERIVINRRSFQDGDIKEASFVIAATDDEQLNSHISEICRTIGKPVNVVDVKEECSFVFPAIIKQEDLVIAISTGGNSPAMAGRIKREVSDSIPGYYGKMIGLLGATREYIKSSINIPEDRMRAYEELIDIAMLNEGKVTPEIIRGVVEKYRAEE